MLNKCIYFWPKNKMINIRQKGTKLIKSAEFSTIEKTTNVQITMNMKHLETIEDKILLKEIKVHVSFDQHSIDAKMLTKDDQILHDLKQESMLGGLFHVSKVLECLVSKVYFPSVCPPTYLILLQHHSFLSNLGGDRLPHDRYWVPACSFLNP